MSVHVCVNARVTVNGVALMDAERRPIGWADEALQFFAMLERKAKRWDNPERAARRRTPRYLAKGGVKK
jgi:hypothetical protein